MGCQPMPVPGSLQCCQEGGERACLLIWKVATRLLLQFPAHFGVPGGIPQALGWWWVGAELPGGQDLHGTGRLPPGGGGGAENPSLLCGGGQLPACHASGSMPELTWDRPWELGRKKEEPAQTIQRLELLQEKGMPKLCGDLSVGGDWEGWALPLQPALYQAFLGGHVCMNLPNLPPSMAIETEDRRWGPRLGRGRCPTPTSPDPPWAGAGGGLTILMPSEQRVSSRQRPDEGQAGGRGRGRELPRKTCLPTLPAKGTCLPAMTTYSTYYQGRGELTRQAVGLPGLSGSCRHQQASACLLGHFISFSPFSFPFCFLPFYKQISFCDMGRHVSDSARLHFPFQFSRHAHCPCLTATCGGGRAVWRHGGRETSGWRTEGWQKTFQTLPRRVKKGRLG